MALINALNDGFNPGRSFKLQQDFRLLFFPLNYLQNKSEGTCSVIITFSFNHVLTSVNCWKKVYV
jgi:hypothetical protein